MPQLTGSESFELILSRSSRKRNGICERPEDMATATGNTGYRLACRGRPVVWEQASEAVVGQ